MPQMQNSPNLTDLSHELLCQILKYLPLKEVLAVSTLCKKLSAAVGMHLRLCKSIDFCQGKIYGYMPASITDDHMHSLLKKCPHLETVYGLHPLKVERRRLRKRSALTVPGIIEALCLCYNLKAIETCDLKLLEAVMQVLPQLEIIGNFRNRDGVFPPHASQRLKLQPYPRISSLHLIGVEVPELTAMPHLQHLHLQCVRFTKLQPFRAFLAQNLKTFVMKHCMGPSMSLRYLSLIIALSSSPSLSRLELVRVPLPGGLFQRAVEDSYRHNGFVNLKNLVIAGCKGVLEADLGHLMIVASKNLESLFIQPSLTKDSLFVSLSFAQCEFPKLKNLHLGFVDKLNSSGEWSNDVLLTLGLAEVPDTPSTLTDSGMRVISELFPHIRTLSVSNCPHLMAMDQWSPVEGVQAWKELTDLTLQKCHCLQLPSFALFLALLPKIEVLILNDMFREPPKGCSHVGLSAGTGLGMSSAVVSNQDEHIAVQGHQQDFEPQGDDQLLENDDIDRDYAEMDNEVRPEPHLMVLQQDFFDEQNNVYVPVEIRENINNENVILDDNENNNMNPDQIPIGSINYYDLIEEETTDEETETDDDSVVASSLPVPNEKPNIVFIKQEIDDDILPLNPLDKNICMEGDYIEEDYFLPKHARSRFPVQIGRDFRENRPEISVQILENDKQSKSEIEMNKLSEGIACVSSGTLSVGSVNTDDQNLSNYSKNSEKTAELHNMDSKSDIDDHCRKSCRVCMKLRARAQKIKERNSKRCTYFDPHQPSTSKVVDCPEYSDADSVADFRKSMFVNIDNQNLSDYSKDSEKSVELHNMDSRNDIYEHCRIGCAACIKVKARAQNVKERYSKQCTDFDPYQPSTSKVVDCPEYSDADSVADFRKSVFVNIDNQNLSDYSKDSEKNVELHNMDSRNDIYEHCRIGCAACIKIKTRTQKVKERYSKRCIYFDSHQPSTSKVIDCPEYSDTDSMESVFVNIDDQNLASYSKNSEKSVELHNMDSRSDVDENCEIGCTTCVKVKARAQKHKERYSKRCTYFDHHQPSTSKVVDCPEYSDADSVVDSRKSMASSPNIANDSVFHNKTNRKRLRKTHEEKITISKKIRKHNKEKFNENSQVLSTSFCSTKMKEKEMSNNIPENFLQFKGPLTRQRRKMLAVHVKEDSISCALESQKDLGGLRMSEVSMNARASSSHNKKERNSCNCYRESDLVSCDAINQNRLIKMCTCQHPLQNEQEFKNQQSSKQNSSCVSKISNKIMILKSGRPGCLAKESKDKCKNCQDRDILMQALEGHNNSFTVKTSKFAADKNDENITVKKCRISHGSEVAHHIPCMRRKKEKVVCNHIQEHIISQGTQATSADIRRTLRKFKASKARIVKLEKVPENSSNSATPYVISETHEFRRCKLLKSPKDMQNKSTSTSDPLMEDDAIQTLRLVSETLISLTIVSCGISHIVIDHCQNMTHVEVQACRILKKFQLNYCPCVKRINISQCPKLVAETFFPEIISLAAVNSLIVSFEPCMQSYHPVDGEKVIFSKATPDQSIVLFHDYTDNSHEIVQAVFKESLLGWMEFVQRIYFSLNLQRAKKTRNKLIAENSMKARYPWGHDLRRIHGFYMLPPIPNPCATEWRYEMLTNNHVFAKAFEFLPWDKGVPRAEFCGDYRKLPIYPSVLYEIAERTVQMPKRLITFYIAITESN